MKIFQDYRQADKKQMAQGILSHAYLGLMDYIMELKMYFKNTSPDYFVSGRIYQGYMDMTYFFHPRMFFPAGSSSCALLPGHPPG